MTRRWIAALCLAGATHAQALLEHVPANAKIVVVVRDLDALIERSNAYLEKGCGIPIPRTVVGDITGLLGNLGGAWKTTRGMAFAVSALKADGTAVVFPVDDGAATLAKLGGEPAEGLAKFDLVGRTMFGAAERDVVVVGPGAAAVNAVKGRAGTLAGALAPGQTALAQELVHFHINLEELQPELEKLADDAEQLGGLLPAEGGGRNLAARQAVDYARRALAALAREGKSLHGALDFTREAATLRLAVRFKEGSRAQRLLAGCTPSVRTKDGAAKLFARLPAGRFVAAAGIDAANLMESMKPGGQLESLGIKGFAATLTEDPAGSALLARVEAEDAKALDQTVGGLLGLAAVFAAGRPELKLTSGKRKFGPAEVGELKAESTKLPEAAKAPLQAALGGTALHLQHGLAADAFGLALAGRADGFAALQAGGDLAEAKPVADAAAWLPKGAVAAALLEPVAALRLAQRTGKAAGRADRLAEVALPQDDGVPFAAALTLDRDSATLHLAAPAATMKRLAPVLQALGW